MTGDGLDRLWDDRPASENDIPFGTPPEPGIDRDLFDLRILDDLESRLITAVERAWIDMRLASVLAGRAMRPGDRVKACALLVRHGLSGSGGIETGVLVG